uniref:Uncharacterized protein n=1 Tax=Panagrolaimus superbus TaxID=310955 RepID=A0A914ZCS1_9BILA
MKFGRVFPICVLLFICLQFQISDGVKCSHVAMTGSRDQIDDLLFNATKTKLKEYKGLPGFVHITNGKITCPEACADFWCGTTKETAVFGAGCPQDFYDICSTFSKEITEIQQKGTNDVEYFSRNVFYVSGCGSETDGTKCIKDKQKKAKCFSCLYMHIFAMPIF